jgi:hypothetical protein
MVRTWETIRNLISEKTEIFVKGDAASLRRTTMTIRRAIPTCRFGERSVALGAEIRPDRPAQAGRQRFVPDSPLEGDGFEIPVPGALGEAARARQGGDHGSSDRSE